MRLKWVVAAALIVAGFRAVPALAQYQQIPNFIGTGAGGQFRSAVNARLSGSEPISPTLVPLSFSALPAEHDGALYWCRDCQKSVTCAGGGNGAFAFGENGQWSCAPGAASMNALPAPTGPVSFNTQRATNLAADSVNGDALSRGQSSLNSLASPSANFAMANHTLTGLPPSAAAGQPLVHGQAGGQLTSVTIPSVLSVQSAPALTGTTLTISAPSGLTGTNQIELAVISYQGSPSFTMPSGWTNISGATACQGTNCHRVDYKVVGSEPASYAWTSSASVYMSGEIVLLGHVNPATPIDTSVNGSTSGSSFTISPLTPATSGGELALVAASTGNGIGTGLGAGVAGIRWAWNNVQFTSWGSNGFTIPLTTASGIAVPLTLTNSASGIAASEVLIEGAPTSQLAATIGSDVGPHSMTGTAGDGSNKISNYSIGGVENVKAFGAMGDGATCDDAAIQAAVNLVCRDNSNFINNTIRSVYLPPTPDNSYALCKPIVIPCGNLEFYGAGRTTSALSTVFNGNSLIAGSVPTGTNGLGNQLQLVSSLLSGPGNALKLNGCSGNTCGFAMLSDYLRGKLNGHSAFSLEFTINVQNTVGGNFPILRSILPQPYANLARDVFDAEYFYDSGTSGHLVFLLDTTNSGIVQVNASASSLPAGSTQSFDLDYDGTTTRICQNGSLKGSNSQSGTLVQSPYGAIALPDVAGNGMSFPDQPNSAPFNMPATIDNIRFSNESRYAANGNACPGAPSSKFTDDNHTDLLITFRGCADGSQYCIENASGAFAQYAERSSGVPIWLGIRGSNENHINGLNVHDFDICVNSADCQGLLAIWTPQSLWRNLYSFGVGGTAFNFYNNDWEDRFDNLDENGATVGFEFGGATNHPITNNLHANSSLVCFDYIGAQDGVDAHGEKCSTFGAMGYGWIIKGTQGVWTSSFIDNEGGDPPWVAAIYDNSAGNDAPDTFVGGEFNTYNGAPFVIQDAAGGPPMVFTGTAFQTFAQNMAAAEVVDLLSDPAAPDTLVNVTVPAGVPLSNESGNPHVETVGGTTTTNLQSVTASYLSLGQPPTLLQGMTHLQVNYLANPAAPAISVVGTTGSTSYGPYYVVCHDDNGGSTLYSTGSNTVTNGPATLNSSNHIHIAWTGETGCYSWDLLKGNISTSLATNLAAAPTAFDDVGQSTSAYVAPLRNTTGDVSGGVLLSTGVTFANLPTTPVNGARIFCSDCDPPTNPPVACTHSGARSGAFADGLNGSWICAY
ncbi:MAG TPA: glycosyl hydrolase family 28-related protein [Candidatus Binataceae bacterium]|nr:glycosyl hydrolase family 28-related protein [Candidatus Binataceae bacterium]